MTTKKKMTKAEVRVCIAKDVLAQVKAKRFTARPGLYVSGLGLYSDLPRDEDGYLTQSPINVQAVLKDRDCHVCALGALFVSSVDRFNACELPASDMTTMHRETLEKYLGNVFSRKQMNAIEAAFEGSSNSYPKVYNSAFYQAYPDSTARLVAIMKNIVRNGGTFKPSELRAPR